MLNEFKFNGKVVADHLDAFDTLVNASLLAGYMLDIKQLLFHFANSFTIGNNRAYDAIVWNDKLKKLLLASNLLRLLKDTATSLLKMPAATLPSSRPRSS